MLNANIFARKRTQRPRLELDTPIPLPTQEWVRWKDESLKPACVNTSLINSVRYAHMHISRDWFENYQLINRISLQKKSGFISSLLLSIFVSQIALQWPIKTRCLRAVSWWKQDNCAYWTNKEQLSKTHHYLCWHRLRQTGPANKISTHAFREYLAS